MGAGCNIYIYNMYNVHIYVYIYNMIYDYMIHVYSLHIHCLTKELMKEKEDGSARCNSWVRYRAGFERAAGDTNMTCCV